MEPTAGTIIPFMFDNLPLRGRLIRLPNLAAAIPTLPPHTPAAAQALCEVVLANALMATELKNPDINNEATVTVQIQSTGPVELLTSQCTHFGNLRAYARLAENTPKELNFDALFGSQGGICAVTVDYGPKTKPYQSLIGLAEGSVLKSIEAYYSQSAQVKTVITSALNPQQGHTAAMLFLQEMPGSDPISEDDWNRINYILQTVEQNELLPGELTAETLLMRLFAEDQIRLFADEPLHFKTEHLRTRMELALRQLGEEEVMKMVAEDSQITMTDNFTGQEETFTEAELKVLFTATH